MASSALRCGFSFLFVVFGRFHGAVGFKGGTFGVSGAGFGERVGVTLGVGGFWSVSRANWLVNFSSCPGRVVSWASSFLLWLVACLA